MEEIIKVNEETMTVSARDLLEKVVSTERFSTWFERQLQYGFRENIDYVGCKTFNTLAHQELQDFNCSVDMAKEICMVQKNENAREIRKYLIDLEKAWNTPEQVMARALRIADKTIASLHQTIEEQKPLVEFAEHVSQSSDTVDMEEMAKIAVNENIKIGRNNLIKWLKAQKILKDNRLPYQTFIDRGYFQVAEVTKKTIYGDKIFTKTVVTGKGQIWIIEKLREEFNGTDT